AGVAVCAAVGAEGDGEVAAVDQRAFADPFHLVRGVQGQAGGGRGGAAGEEQGGGQGECELVHRGLVRMGVGPWNRRHRRADSAPPVRRVCRRRAVPARWRTRKTLSTLRWACACRRRAWPARRWSKFRSPVYLCSRGVSPAVSGSPHWNGPTITRRC